MTVIADNKFDQDLQFIMQCLREVLTDLKLTNLVDFVPWLQPKTKPLDHGSVDHGNADQGLVQLLSISFQLLNMVEENTTIQRRRLKQTADHLEDESGLWPWALTQLIKQGFGADDILGTIRKLQVEPVLTAHPTEAKRTAILQHHRDLYLLLVKRENQMWTPIEQVWLKNDFKTVLERLWRTGATYIQRPEVTDELQNVMHYLKNVFPEILSWLDRRFETAWRLAGFDEGLSYMDHDYPTFTLGNWVGGDRDGHPLVTSEITAQTLKALRLNALIVLRHKLQDLSKKLTIADHKQNPPEPLLSRLSHYQATLPEQYGEAIKQHPDEPWLVLTNIMIGRLPIQVVRDHATELGDADASYLSPTELMDDFRILHESLTAIGAGRLAENELRQAVRTLQTVGFHLAKLDIRQNSQFHDKAMMDLLQLAGIQEADSFLDWSEERKTKFIRSELLSPRPFSPPNQSHSGEAKAVVDCLKVVRTHVDRYGPEGIGSLIVSMTHSANDLFTMYLLAREAGLLRLEGGHLVCKVPVVPLFETIDDLERSERILIEFLNHPITKASLEDQRVRMGRSKPIQQIMIGYSDSSKDGGVMASQWNLYKAQKAMHGVAERLGLEINFFHGRGGTIGRGSGPIHRFLQAQPKGTMMGSFRVTEQGETIARKYGNVATAVYNVETMLATVTSETLQTNRKQPDEPLYLQAMDKLSRSSQLTYQTLVQDSRFLGFFRSVTPIDVLERLRIGSRPAKRTGQATIADLRAIPWVFSWIQSRFYLPSWYGVGTALETLQKDSTADFNYLVSNLGTLNHLNYLLHNVETTVASASPEIMGWYANLLDDRDVRAFFMQLILDEYERTRRMLVHVFGSPVEGRRPQAMRTIAMRETGLRTLHKLQIEQIRAWRNTQHSSINNAPNKESDHILNDLLVTVSALASGLRNTG
jgi:phosphoenolpyruvate carboxylase